MVCPATFAETMQVDTMEVDSLTEDRCEIYLHLLKLQPHTVVDAAERRVRGRPKRNG